MAFGMSPFPLRFGSRQGGGGAAAYEAVPVNFDGTNDYLLRGGALTSVSDGKTITCSVWLRRGSSGSAEKVLDGATLLRTSIYWEASNVFEITLRAAAGTNLAIVRSVATVADSNWHHIVLSMNIANASQRHLYIDDASSLNAIIYTDGTANFAQSNYGVGATTAGASKLNGDIADLQVWFNEYVDLSVEANRRLFLLADGKPADPAVAAASIRAPDILLSGALPGWITNKGGGGGFTLTGELSAGTGPVQIPL